MTSILDPTTIGKPKRPRRHVRSLTGTVSSDLFAVTLIYYGPIPGYHPEKDESGKEKWPRGEENVWKDGYRHLDTGECPTHV